MYIIIPASGILNKREGLKFKMMLLQAKLKENINKYSSKIRLKTYTNCLLEDIKIPDSSLAVRAIEEAHEHYSPTLLSHCYRTYFWSAGFAFSENLKVDSELLFVSSILHDIGLSNKHNHICTKQCFANYGGSFSKHFTLMNGLEKERALVIEQSINLHLNPMVNKYKHGNEAYALSKGAAMDVIGANYFQFQKDYILSVNKMYSRIKFKEDIIRTMEELQHKKNTRADILYSMGFAKMADKNILDIM